MFYEDPITVIFIIIITMTFIFGKKILSHSEIPSVLTTIGIFGTFLGITYGLIDFNSNDVYGSVPKLLDGLKIAFWTSIFGMGAAIIFKISSGVERRKADSYSNEYSNIEKMIKELQMENVQLKNIEKILSEKESSPLLKEILSLNKIVSEKHSELKQEFHNFTEKIVENNSKALIEALTKVIKDFNVKIDEQFGGNFNKLEQSIEKMLNWQEKYKEQIDVMINQFEESVKLINEVEKSITNIKSDFVNIASTSEELKKIVEVFNFEIETMKDIADNAKNVFPIIEDNIFKLTHEFSKNVLSAIKKLSELSEFQEDNINKQSKNLIETNKHMSEALQEASSQIDSMMQKNAERISRQVNELDKSLQEELTKSLNSLASQLGSLSAKFAEDYTPITDKLNKMLQSFDKVKKNG